MSTYAIGDVQGSYAQLQRLLERLKFDPASDQIWLLGDLVNRGPQSLEVVRLARSLGRSARALLGNHDLHFLAVAAGTKPPSKKDTLDALLTAPDAAELIAWFRQLPLALHTDAPNGPWLAVHAGVIPSWSLADCLRYSAELQALLQSDGFNEFLPVMYGNEPSRFAPSLAGHDRHRALINIFTRMRFCAADGTIDLSAKGPASAAPPGMLPWFKHPQRETKDIQLLFGHWAALRGVSNERNVHALDTGCAWARSLTALRLEDQQRFSCDCG